MFLCSRDAQNGVNPKSNFPERFSPSHTLLMLVQKILVRRAQVQTVMTLQQPFSAGLKYSCSEKKKRNYRTYATNNRCEKAPSTRAIRNWMGDLLCAEHVSSSCLGHL